MPEVKEALSHVRKFWDTEACGTHFVKGFHDDRDFYAQFRAYRYRTEWHIPELVPFSEARGKKVLEIGVGNGADGAMFAESGADYTGVDLTEAALTATRRHFEVLGLSGNLERANAENLQFPDASFDIVYSHGVLHHTANTQRAIDEVHRVLRPGGHAIVMLYHKHSFNYYVRIMTYMRLRVLFTILTRSRRWKDDRRHLQSDKVIGVRGNIDRRVWEIHYQNFLRDGWKYLRAKNFVHHATDGPECPIAFAYSKKEARILFSKFRSLEFRVAHFPLRKYSRLFPMFLERFLASRIGWYLFAFATK